VVSDPLPINVPCDAFVTFSVSGQLGYSGSVTILVDAF
jgi:hypothetical protein